MKSNSKKYDVIIIGGGAAGMSAALWCAELKIKALLLESDEKPGGQLHIVHNPIENHLGVTAKNGKELNRIFQKQIQNREFEICFKAKVFKVNFKNKQIFLENGQVFSARAIVIATGVSRRKLGVDGEERFQSKGILRSGKQDAKKVKGKTVCVIGGGDAALENVAILAEKAAKVYLIHRRESLGARPEFIEKAKSLKNVEMLMQTSVVEILGKDKIDSLKLKNSLRNETFILPTDALLIRIGVSANTEVFREKLKLDGKGYVKINSNCETNVKDIYAIGDVANPTAPTISSAIGMGATVAKVLFDKLDNIQ